MFTKEIKKRNYLQAKWLFMPSFQRVQTDLWANLAIRVVIDTPPPTLAPHLCLRHLKKETNSEFNEYCQSVSRSERELRYDWRTLKLYSESVQCDETCHMYKHMKPSPTIKTVKISITPKIFPVTCGNPSLLLLPAKTGNHWTVFYQHRRVCIFWHAT